MRPSKILSLFFITASCTALAGPAATLSTPAALGVKAKIISSLSGSSSQAQAASSRAYNGALVIVDLELPEKWKSASLKGEFEGKEIPFFEAPGRQYEGLFGVPVEHEASQAQVIVRASLSSGQHEEFMLPFAIVDGGYPSETIKVQPSKVNPPHRSLKRVLREQAEIGKIYANSAVEQYWSGPFISPLDTQVVTSAFGSHRVYNGEKRNYHYGVDLRAPVGTPVHAAGAGKVVLAKDLYFTGNTVILDHGRGLFTIYCHMSKLEVKRGSQVRAGNLLGLAGQTGRANGPHLHWGALIHRVKINPTDLTKVLR